MLDSPLVRQLPSWPGGPRATTASQGFMTRAFSSGRVKVHATLHGFTDKERALELPEGARADDAPRALGIRPELVLVFRSADDGAGGSQPLWRPLPADEPLRDGDRIRILRVVSGG